jgi:hypothetical protein
MKFYIEIITPLTFFKGEILEGSIEDYNMIKSNILEVYKDEFFEIDLQDGSYLTLNKNIIQNSIFKIVKI